jgi:hypothetical protein
MRPSREAKIGVSEVEPVYNISDSSGQLGYRERKTVGILAKKDEISGGFALYA